MAVPLTTFSRLSAPWTIAVIVLVGAWAVTGCGGQRRGQTNAPPTAVARTAASAPVATSTTGRAADGGVTVVAAGDIACPPTERPARKRCGQAATARLAASVHPAAVLPLGDNQYEAGRIAEYRGSYARSWGRLMSLTHPAPGNHEYAASTTAAGYRTYFGDRGVRDGATYYSYDIGAWHLIALDSNCGSVGGCHRGSPQQRWLAADLAAHPTRCALAYWHHPRFSSGVLHGPTLEVDPLFTTLDAAGVDVLLSGHEHQYERFAPQHHDGKAAIGGVRQFVVGTGGFSLYPFGRRSRNSQVRHNDSFGVLVLRLRPKDFAWTFRPTTRGAGTDRGSAPCR
jgi:hypothetical protein